jgi:hypothetical protein
MSVGKKRVWRLRGALVEVIERIYVSRTALRVLLGHFTRCALMRREAISIVHACYAFVETVSPSQVRLCAGVRREFSETIAMLPLLRTNFSAAWLTTGAAVDASVSGIGIGRRTTDPLEIGMLGAPVNGGGFKSRAPSKHRKAS